jgi:hypothetical protein
MTNVGFIPIRVRPWVRAFLLGQRAAVVILLIASAGLIAQTIAGPSTAFHSLWVNLVIWSCVALSAALTLGMVAGLVNSLRLARAAGKHRFHACSRCLYDRAGTMDAPTCPECGVSETGHQALARWTHFCTKGPIQPVLVGAFLTSEARKVLREAAAAVPEEPKRAAPPGDVAA